MLEHPLLIKKVPFENVSYFYSFRTAMNSYSKSDVSSNARDLLLSGYAFVGHDGWEEVGHALPAKRISPRGPQERASGAGSSNPKGHEHSEWGWCGVKGRRQDGPFTAIYDAVYPNAGRLNVIRRNPLLQICRCRPIVVYVLGAYWTTILSCRQLGMRCPPIQQCPFTFCYVELP
jgi:hypothetical protein